MEEGRSAFKILTGKPTGKIPLGRPRRRLLLLLLLLLQFRGLRTLCGSESSTRQAVCHQRVVAKTNFRYILNIY